MPKLPLQDLREVTAWQSCALLCTSASARLIKPSVLLSMSACALSASSATAWPTRLSSSAWQSRALLSTSSRAMRHADQRLIKPSVLLSTSASASSASSATSATV